MADEKLTPEQIEELNKYKETASLVGVSIDGVTPETYKEILEALKKAEKDFVSTPTNTDTENKTDVGKDEHSEEKKEDKGVTVDGEKKEEKENTNEEAPEIADWIKKKIQDYEKMSNGEIEGCPKLEGYKHDESIKDGFAADFNGGHIHYTAPDNVIVSKESGLVVFETLVTEPDNKGRPVNFGQSLDHEQAVKLMAACLLHDNPIGDNAPKLSVEDLKAIEAELKDRPEDLKKFQEKVASYVQTQQNTDAIEGEQPKPVKENAEETQPKAFDDETKKQIKEALNNQYDMEDMVRSGKIVLKGSAENLAIGGSDEDTKRYLELKDKQKEDKKFLAEKFIENPDEMRSIISEMIKEKTNGHTKQSELTDTEKSDLATVRQVQISALRDRMAKNGDEKSSQLMEHDKRILALSGRLKDGDKVFVTTKDGETKEVKALEGTRKTAFEARNKDAIERAMANYNAHTK